MVAQATDGDFVDGTRKRERKREGEINSKQKKTFFCSSSSSFSQNEKTSSTALGLRRDNFADTHALLCLHVWLLLVRLRAEGANGAQAAQLLYDFFSDDAEVRVRAAGVRVRVSKWLAELEKMFYGAATAYDKALGSPGGGGGKEGGGGEFTARPFAPPADARRALSDALLRNVFGDDAGKRPKANLLSDYVIREIACLAQTGSDAVLDGRLRFTGGGGGDVGVANRAFSAAAAASAGSVGGGGAETAAA